MSHKFYGSPDFRKLNPHLFGRVGGLETNEPKPNKEGEAKDRSVESRPRCSGFRIKLIQLRHRLLDGHDNMRTACKPAVDRITSRLGFSSDSDPRLQWEYHQLKTEGKEGLLVTIEPIDV